MMSLCYIDSPRHCHCLFLFICHRLFCCFVIMRTFVNLMNVRAISRAVSSSSTLLAILMFLSASLSPEFNFSSYGSRNVSGWHDYVCITSSFSLSPVSSCVSRPFRHRLTKPIHSRKLSISFSSTSSIMGVGLFASLMLRFLPTSALFSCSVLKVTNIFDPAEYQSCPVLCLTTVCRNSLILGSKVEYLFWHQFWPVLPPTCYQVLAGLILSQTLFYSPSLWRLWLVFMFLFHFIFIFLTSSAINQLSGHSRTESESDFCLLFYSCSMLAGRRENPEIAKTSRLFFLPSAKVCHRQKNSAISGFDRHLSIKISKQPKKARFCLVRW